MPGEYNAGSVKAFLEMDTSQWEKSISKANSAIETAARYQEQRFGRMRAAADAVANRLNIMGVVGVGGFVALAAKAGQFAEELEDLSKTTNLSTSTLQRYRHVMLASGDDFNALTKAVGLLNSKLMGIEEGKGDATKALKSLGIETEGVKLQMDKLVPTVIGRLQEMQDGTQRNALAAKLFGKSWQEIAPLLAMSRAEFEKMAGRAQVIPPEEVKRLAEFQDNLSEFKVNLENISRTMAAEFVPMVSKGLKGIQQFAQGHEGMIGKLVMYGGFGAILASGAIKATLAITNVVNMGKALVFQYGLMSAAAQAQAVAQTNAAAAATAEAAALRAMLTSSANVTAADVAFVAGEEAKAAAMTASAAAATRQATAIGLIGAAANAAIPILIALAGAAGLVKVSQDMKAAIAQGQRRATAYNTTRQQDYATLESFGLSREEIDARAVALAEKRGRKVAGFDALFADERRALIEQEGPQAAIRREHEAGLTSAQNLEQAFLDAQARGDDAAMLAIAKRQLDLTAAETRTVIDAYHKGKVSYEDMTNAKQALIDAREKWQSLDARQEKADTAAKRAAEKNKPKPVLEQGIDATLDNLLARAQGEPGFNPDAGMVSALSSFLDNLWSAEIPNSEKQRRAAPYKRLLDTITARLAAAKPGALPPHQSAVQYPDFTGIPANTGGEDFGAEARMFGLLGLEPGKTRAELDAEADAFVAEAKDRERRANDERMAAHRQEVAENTRELLDVADQAYAEVFKYPGFKGLPTGTPADDPASFYRLNLLPPGQEPAGALEPTLNAVEYALKNHPTGMAIGAAIWNASRDAGAADRYFKDILGNIAAKNFQSLWANIFAPREGGSLASVGMAQLRRLASWMGIKDPEAQDRAFAGLGDLAAGAAGLNIDTTSSLQGAMQGAGAGASIAEGLAKFGVAIPGLNVAAPLLGALFGLNSARERREEIREQIARQQLIMLERIDNHLKPVADYLIRGAFSGLAPSRTYGGGLDTAAWALANRRGMM